MQKIKRLLRYTTECTEFDFECMYPSIIFKGVHNIDQTFLTRYKNTNKKELYKKLWIYDKESRRESCNDHYLCKRLVEEYHNNFDSQITSSRELNRFAADFTSKIRCELLVEIAKYFPHLNLFADYTGFADQIVLNTASVTMEDEDKIFLKLSDFLQSKYHNKFNMRKKTTFESYESRCNMTNFKERKIETLVKLPLHYLEKCGLDVI